MKHFIHLSRRNLILVGVVILALVVTGVTLANTIIIDHFDGEAIAGSVSSSVPNASGGNPTVAANALGGYHTFTLTQVAGTQTNTLAININGSSFMSFNQGSGSTSLAMVRWDGDNNPALNPIGLQSVFPPNGADLTDGNTNTTIAVLILENDNPVGVTLKFWEDANHCREFTFNTPGNNLAAPTIIAIPMTSFTTVCPGATDLGTATPFSQIGAIEMLLDGTVTTAADVSIEFVDATGEAYDYGDLPSSYGSIVTGANAGRHSLGTGLRLGAGVDAEVDGQPTTGANGDDINPTGAYDDEDGVTKYTAGGFTWKQGTIASGNGGALNVVVSGKANACRVTVFPAVNIPCYVNGWIDWNNDGVFDAGEHVLASTIPAGGAGSGVVNSLGTSVLFFDIPGTAGTILTNVHYYARFRLCGGSDSVLTDDCNTPGGALPSAAGEVEDYIIQFGPLSVDLASFTADKAGDHNALAWETTSELKNQGFNVWRGTSASGPDTKLNTYLIPSQAPGGTDGFAYSYDDSNIASGVNYYYWLEDVDLNGTVTRHGPVQVLGGTAPSAVTLTALQANSPMAALPIVAFGLAMMAGLGVVVVHRRH